MRELIKVYGLIIAPWSGLWQVTVVGKGVMMMMKVKIERLPQKKRKNGGDELRAIFPKLFVVTYLVTRRARVLLIEIVGKDHNM